MPTNLNDELAVYVLNMEQSKQRWQHIDQHLKGLGLLPTRIDAVNGRQLSSDELNKHYDSQLNATNYFWPLTPPEVGCFLSHRKAMQTFLADPKPKYLLLLEDDIEIDSKFSSNIDTCLKLVDTKSPRLLKLYTKRLAKGFAINQIEDIKIVRPNLIPLGTPAQLLNRQAAQLFLDNTNKFHMPVDVFYQFWWQHNIDVLSTSISLIREISAQLDGTSIGKVRNISKLSKIKRELGRSFFRFKLSIRSRFLRLMQGNP